MRYKVKVFDPEDYRIGFLDGLGRLEKAVEAELNYKGVVKLEYAIPLRLDFTTGESNLQKTRDILLVIYSVQGES